MELDQRTMRKSELRDLIDRVRMRHNRRVLCIVALMFVAFIGGFGLAPKTSSDPSTISGRRLYVYGIMVVYLAIAVVGGLIIIYLAKTDCAKFRVLCPKCGLNLYSLRRLFLAVLGRETREFVRIVIIGSSMKHEWLNRDLIPEQEGVNLCGNERFTDRS